MPLLQRVSNPVKDFRTLQLTTSSFSNYFVALLHEISVNRKVFVLYLIPAFLYCLYNNLAFVNLTVFDPTTYFLLLQLRVVVTAVLFQVMSIRL